MTHNAPERHRHNNQRHHHYARSPVRSYYGVARAASRYNALNVVGSTLARLSPVPLRTTAHPHSSTIPQNIPQKGGHLSRSKSARIKACRYDRLSPSTDYLRLSRLQALIVCGYFRLSGCFVTEKCPKRS